MVTIQKPSKKIVITSLIILLIVGGVLVVLGLNKESLNQKSTQTPNNTTPASDVNLAPPSEADKKSVESNKEKIVSRNEELKNNQDTASIKSVAPIITYAGKYADNVEIGGYVNGVFEDGGTCTAILTKDSIKISEQVNAVKNVNSMDCPAIVIPASKFSSGGEWSLTLEYSSSTAGGNSEPRKITVSP